LLQILRGLLVKAGHLRFGQLLKALSEVGVEVPWTNVCPPVSASGKKSSGTSLL